MDDGNREDATDGRSARGGVFSRRRATFAGTALVVVGLLAAVRAVDVDAVVADVTGADPLLLGVATVVYAVSWPLRGRRYGDVLATMGHRVGTGFLTTAVFASQTANLAIPARAGDAVRAYLVKDREGVPYPTGFGSLAVERVFDLLTIATLAGGAVLAFALLGDSSPLGLVDDLEYGRRALEAASVVATAAVVVATAAVGVAYSDRALGPRLRTRVSRWPRLRRGVDALLDLLVDVQRVATNPRAVATVGVESLLVWGLDVLTAVVVLAAVGAGLDAPTLLVVGTLAVSVGNLAKVLPLSQGGIGLYEAAFTGLVVGLTPVGASTALAGAIVDHALKNAITLVGGAGALASLNVSLSTAATDGRTAVPDEPADD